MEIYNDLAYSGRVGSGERLPQIVGLTASLGAGGNSAKTLDDAVSHVIKMCAQISARKISRVRRYVQDLQSFANVTNEGWIYYEIIFNWWR